MSFSVSSQERGSTIICPGKKKTQDLNLNPIRHRAQDHRINAGWEGGGAILGTHSHSYCSAWLRPKLNTKMTLNPHHPPPQTFLRVLGPVGG